MQMTALIICGVLSIILILLGTYLMTGRGWFLLAGYNTMPKNKKEQYDTVALCKFIGKIVLLVGVLTFFLGIESIEKWFTWAYIVIVICLCIFSAVYCNRKGNRFKK
jgi:hypothetical protein